VFSAHNEHTPLGVASCFKILTALVASEQLPPNTPVPVSRVAEGMPARKINLKAGQTWNSDDLMHSMLMVSANDAAVALAEKAGGSLAGFDVLLQDLAKRLQLADHPVMRDPAGLDDEFSFQGGNAISARDLAIAARAALAVPRIATVMLDPDYRFK